MKILLSFAACISYTVLAFGQGNSEPTSLTFVRSILNASPSTVEKRLGKPDRPIQRTSDCSDAAMESCDVATYKNGMFETVFYKGRLKGLFIYRNDLFGKNALEVIGFPSSPPTWANQFVHSWRDAAHRGTARGPLIPVKGIDDINVFPARSNKPGFMAIGVSLSYTQSFAK
jgi:hypothetical protein